MWAVEICRIDILLEVSLISTPLVPPQEGRIEQVLHILLYLKIHKNMRLMFDSGYPRISSNLFKVYDWSDLYRDEKEAITTNIT